MRHFLKKSWQNESSKTISSASAVNLTKPQSTTTQLGRIKNTYN